MSDERTFLRAEWYRHGLHDPKSMKADELRQEVRRFMGVLFGPLTATPSPKEESE